MARQRWLPVVFLGFVLHRMSGRTQATVTAPAPPPAASPASPARAVQPASAATVPNDIESGTALRRYLAATLEAYRDATARVEQQAATRKAGAWAVILDADETVISNLQYQIERDRAGLFAGELGGVGP